MYAKTDNNFTLTIDLIYTHLLAYAQLIVDITPHKTHFYTCVKLVCEHKSLVDNLSNAGVYVIVCGYLA